MGFVRTVGTSIGLEVRTSPASQIHVSHQQVSALFPSPEQSCIQICDWLREFPSSSFSFRLLCDFDGNAEQKDGL